MTDTAESTRRFRVYARDTGNTHARIVEETSFEAAAIAYLEHFDLTASDDDDPCVRVIVHDVGTGHEHCFLLDLESGDTAPCG